MLGLGLGPRLELENFAAKFDSTGFELDSVGFWLDIWLARPSRMNPDICLTGYASDCWLRYRYISRMNARLCESIAFLELRHYSGLRTGLRCGEWGAESGAPLVAPCSRMTKFHLTPCRLRGSGRGRGSGSSSSSSSRYRLTTRVSTVAIWKLNM